MSLVSFIFTAPVAALGVSSCFDETVSVGPHIASQQAVGDHGSISVVNGANSELWIQWISSEHDDGPFASSWTSALSTAGVPNYWWMNDASHSMGLFKLAASESALLPYMGVSSRVAPSVGCDAGDSPQGKLTVAAGQAIVASCSSSRGGTPSPQTLVEWTFTPSVYDVIDSSFVDGYSMPVRLEYKEHDNQGFKTILGKLSEADCSSGDGAVVHDENGNFVGCQSPCSATNDDAACCRGSFDTPQTCHPGGKPVSPEVPVWCTAVTKMFSEDGKRLGYCYAYDDDAGSIVDQEKGIDKQDAPRVKVTFCDYASSDAGRLLAAANASVLV